jgi:hypothetical protein
MHDVPELSEQFSTVRAYGFGHRDHDPLDAATRAADPTVVIAARRRQRRRTPSRRVLQAVVAVQEWRWVLRGAGDDEVSHQRAQDRPRVLDDDRDVPVVREELSLVRPTGWSLDAGGSGKRASWPGRMVVAKPAIP